MSDIDNILITNFYSNLKYDFIELTTGYDSLEYNFEIRLFRIA